MKLNEVYLIIYCLNCIRRDQNSTYKACSKRRILHVPNAFKTIENQLKLLLASLSIVLNAFGACKMRRLEQA
jgi:hypothetical protein